MRAALTLQAAALTLLGALLLALAVFAPTVEEPAPTITWRPSTEQERQQSDRDLLIEELLRQQEAGR